MWYLGGDSLIKLKNTKHTKYWCGYHFVWIPKHHRNILVGEIEEHKGLSNSILKELGCEPIALEVMPDHTHVFTPCPPRYAPPYVRYMKGKSSRKLMQKFPEIRTKTKSGKLWSRSYFAATVGNLTEELRSTWRSGGKMRRTSIVRLSADKDTENKLKLLCSLSAKLWNEVNYERSNSSPKVVLI